MSGSANILEVRNVCKRFGGLQALCHITFDLPDGQILGLIGPNGAGKTTLFNVINGVYAPDEGQVKFRGRTIAGWRPWYGFVKRGPYRTHWPPYYVSRLGLARTHQVVRPLNDLTVLENVIAGASFGHERHSLAKAQDIADEVLTFVGLDKRRNMLAASLNVAQKKRLELARALAARPQLLLLDEVLAGLNPIEIGDMVQVVRKIRERGVTILIIEHVMHALMNVSDRVIVLDYGEQIAEGTPAEVASDPKVIQAYLGDPALAERLMGNNRQPAESRLPEAGE